MTASHLTDSTADKSWRVGDDVLVTSVEMAGRVTHLLDNGAFYVLLENGETIACGHEVMERPR